MALILIADDLPQVRQLLRFSLNAQHTVLEAANGGDALDILRREPVDVAILDCMMPVLTGIQVCQWLRADPAMHTMRVIIISANASQSQALQAGADRFIAKPFSPSELLATVDALVQGASLNRGIPPAETLCALVALVAGSVA